MKKKKKKSRVEQLNKPTVLKLIFVTVLILIVEAAAGIFIFYQFNKNVYAEELAVYQSRTDELSRIISEKYPNNVSDVETDSAMLADVQLIMQNSGEFEYYVVFSQASGGRLLADGGVLNKPLLSDFGLKYDEKGYVELNGKTYLFVPSGLGGGHGIGGLTDFTERQIIMKRLRDNIIVTLAAAGLLIFASMLLYAYITSNAAYKHKFKYKLTINSAGKILKCNADFKRHYSGVKEIKTSEVMHKKDFNLVRLTSTEGEKILAMRMGSPGIDTTLYAGEVANAETFIQTQGSVELAEEGTAETSLSKIYESFISTGKRTLIGVMFISNLEQIRTLFGKQMALDIQKTIVKKVREKFTYAYELDFASIGVAYPDGRKLDILLADMDDIYRYISAPIKKDDNLFTIGLQTGFAICDSSMEDRSFEYAMKAAEAARQRVIDTKIAEYIIYHESQKKLYSKYFIKFDIKQMLAEGAFEMEYQPQYNIKEERVEGFEALFRVKKSWNVNVDTFSFITYAERTGAMVQLGDFIFDTGMQFAKKLEGKNVSVSLNVSPVQLMQAGFTENFLRLYRKYDLKPGSICVEITESFLMTNFNETLKKLDMLTSSGITVHLDDFGTEYSSLLYIKKLPVSTIKIDKEFVKDVLVSKESQAIIKFITNIAKLLNRTTICEGVETPQEYDMLNYLGCDTIQGWVIGKSMKPDDALKFVETFNYKKMLAERNAKNG